MATIIFSTVYMNFSFRRKQLFKVWWKLIWFSKAIPKHAFINWLAIKDRLSTCDRLAKWGYNANILCIFCRGAFGV
jgi:hypothetical protein